MAQTARHAIEEEFAQLRRDTSDPELDAVQVAIYLEDALGVVIPDSRLCAHYLSTAEAARLTVDSLESIR